VPGRPDPANAKAVIAVIARAVDLVMRGEASALTTGPIHKKALIDGAGFAYPGHTEYLAHLAGVDRVVMMLASSTAPTCASCRHDPHRAQGRARRARRRAPVRHDPHHRRRAAPRFRRREPPHRRGGLNPHAGEGGVMGREEIEIIAPVIEALRAEGFGVTGPHSADTMFHAAARARYDAAIAMYHDQALIPIKTLAFDEGVNVTLGLPFIRTSPDHGTAFDIAGTGRANPASLIAALEMAADHGRTRAAARTGAEHAAGS
jgi:4-hydroxythreonine-4-phosphate dehydrogenase